MQCQDDLVVKYPEVSMKFLQDVCRCAISFINGIYIIIDFAHKKDVTVITYSHLKRNRRAGDENLTMQHRSNLRTSAALGDIF